MHPAAKRRMEVQVQNDNNHGMNILSWRSLKDGQPVQVPPHRSHSRKVPATNEAQQKEGLTGGFPCGPS